MIPAYLALQAGSGGRASGRRFMNGVADIVYAQAGYDAFWSRLVGADDWPLGRLEPEKLTRGMRRR